jgi:hypothetical protein
LTLKPGLFEEPRIAEHLLFGEVDFAVVEMGEEQEQDGDCYFEEHLRGL